MAINFESNLLRSLPQQILHSSRQINHSNHNYLAWNAYDAYEASKAFIVMDYAIAGSMMYGESEETFFFLGYDWSFFQENLEWQNYKMESAKKALQFIKNNSTIMGNEYYYILIPTDQHLFKMRRLLPSFFDDELCYSGIALDELGIYEVAWEYKNIKQAIQCYLDHNYRISGGDFYEEVNGKIVPALGSWSVKEEGYGEDIHLNDIDRYLKYIKNYHQIKHNLGKDFYSIVAMKR